MAFPVDEERIEAAEHGPWQLHPVWDGGDRRGDHETGELEPMSTDWA